MNRSPTKEEYERGWMALGCNEHAFVFRAETLRIIPKEAIEFCGAIEGPAVRLDALKKTTPEKEAMTAEEVAEVRAHFHHMWGRDVGKDGYDKKRWQRFEALMEMLLNATVSKNKLDPAHPGIAKPTGSLPILPGADELKPWKDAP